MTRDEFDFSIYLNLEMGINSYDDYLFDFQGISDLKYLNFNLPFDNVSLMTNPKIEQIFHDKGFYGLFQDAFLKFKYFDDFKEILNNIDTELRITNKYNQTFIFTMEKDGINRAYWHWYNLIKISKKTNKCIGVSYKAGNSSEMQEYFSFIPYLTNAFTGFTIKHLDGNNKNLRVNNLIILPKGYSLNRLMKETSKCNNFFYFSDLEETFENATWEEIYICLMDKSESVWLNHNIVCILMDKFILSVCEREDNPNKRSFDVIDLYAQKFGLYSTIDRIVLAYWKFIVKNFLKMFSLYQPNIKYNVEVSGQDTSWNP